MKKIITSFFLATIILSAVGQIKKPAKWSEAKLSKSNPEIGETIEVTFNVTIDEGWYLYSSDFDPDLGPIVTTFDYEGTTGIEIVGKVKPINPKKAFDDLWGGEYTYFEPTGQFKQKIKITAKDPVLAIKVEFQTCQHEGSCISDKKKYSINIKTKEKKAAPVDNTTKSNTEKTAVKNPTKNPSDVSKTTDKVEPTSNDVVNETANSNMESSDTNDTTSSNVENSEMSSNTTHSSGDKGMNLLASSKGDFGKGKDGADYVRVAMQWHKVPKNNSPKFYQKYLMITGNK